MYFTFYTIVSKAFYTTRLFLKAVPSQTLRNMWTYFEGHLYVCKEGIGSHFEPFISNSSDTDKKYITSLFTLIFRCITQVCLLLNSLPKMMYHKYCCLIEDFEVGSAGDKGVDSTMMTSSEIVLPRNRIITLY